MDVQGTELVGLSACETGLGETQNGEGVFGLRRALQEAGAGAVLMSMWSVPDQGTRELMQLFYTHWLNGEEKHAALRAAELEEREQVKSVTAATRITTGVRSFWSGSKQPCAATSSSG